MVEFVEEGAGVLTGRRRARPLPAERTLWRQVVGQPEQEPAPLPAAVGALHQPRRPLGPAPLLHGAQLLLRLRPETDRGTQSEVSHHRTQTQSLAVHIHSRAQSVHRDGTTRTAGAERSTARKGQLYGYR